MFPVDWQLTALVTAFDRADVRNLGGVGRHPLDSHRERGNPTPSGPFAFHPKSLVESLATELAFLTHK